MPYPPLGRAPAPSRPTPIPFLLPRPRCPAPRHARAPAPLLAVPPLHAGSSIKQTNEHTTPSPLPRMQRLRPCTHKSRLPLSPPHLLCFPTFAPPLRSLCPPGVAPLPAPARLCPSHLCPDAPSLSCQCTPPPLHPNPAPPPLLLIDVALPPCIPHFKPHFDFLAGCHRCAAARAAAGWPAACGCLPSPFDAPLVHTRTPSFCNTGEHKDYYYRNQPALGVQSGCTNREQRRDGESKIGMGAPPPRVRLCDKAPLGRAALRHFHCFSTLPAPRVQNGTSCSRRAGTGRSESGAGGGGGGGG